MVLFRMARSVRTIIFFILLALPFSSIHATEYYAFRLPGSDCTLCHIDPKNGSLNEEGDLFLARGYRYPFTLKGTFFYFLAILTFSIILFGLRRRYQLWHIGKGSILWDQCKVERIFFKCLGTSNHFKKFFPGGKPPLPIFIFSHPEPFGHDDSHPGISHLPLREDKIHRHRNLPLFSSRPGPLRGCWMVGNDPSHLPEIYSET